MKKCRRCGELKPLSAFNKVKRNFKRLKTICKDCERKQRNIYRTRTALGRAADMIGKAKTRARAFGLPFDITTQWLRKRMGKGVCEVTGLPLDLGPSRIPGQANTFAPSIDRIDNSRGYTQDNCRVVVWIFNRAKGSDTDLDVIQFARALLEQ